jgi:hypothetical protein
MSPNVDEALLHTFPERLRNAYRGALSEHDPQRRHKSFLQLAEVGLRLLASISLSEYGSQRWSRPDPKVEEVLARSQRPSMGHYVGILRQCVAAVPNGVLSVRSGESDLPLEAARRLAAAVNAIEEAIELEAKNITVSLRLALDQPDQSSLRLVQTPPDPVLG